MKAGPWTSTTEAPGCFYYHYLTASPTIDGMDEHRHSHTFGFTMSRSILPHILIGGAVKYFSYTSDLMGESDASGFNWDVGATVFGTLIRSTSPAWGA